MNLEDVIDPEYGLQQDDYSLSGVVFGEEGQLQVVGWSGRFWSAKKYILFCNECSKDPELFGEGYFISLKGSLLRGQTSCGCSFSPKWSKDQYSILCSRKAKELGYTFIGFEGEWKGSNTKIKMLCEKHGEWSTGTVGHLINGGRACKLCGRDASRASSVKPDEIMIDSFIASGVFHPDTKFWRSERKTKAGVNAYWKIYCPECNQTGEAVSCSLQKGKRPCLCTRPAQWSEDQYHIKVYSKAESLGYTFLGFEGEWKGPETKGHFICSEHGKWVGNTKNVISGRTGCIMCGREKASQSKRKPDDVMIESFFASGAFHPDTKFWRGVRKTKRGSNSYWFMECPDCGEIGEAVSGDLQRGGRPCGCNMQRQQEAYINWVIDENNNAVAIKFGIARDSKRRVKDQNRHSTYTLKQHAVYSFPSVQQCKQAERECKKELETGVVLKRDMPDGWTETTWSYNIGKVIDIYKRNGGLLV